MVAWGGGHGGAGWWRPCWHWGAMARCSGGRGGSRGGSGGVTAAVLVAWRGAAVAWGGGGGGAGWHVWRRRSVVAALACMAAAATCARMRSREIEGNDTYSDRGEIGANLGRVAR